MANKKKIGEILVDKGLVTPKTVERIMDHAKKTNRKIGAILEEIALVTADEIAEALSVQYGYKYIKNFTHYSFPEELMELIPKEVAIKHNIFPLKVMDTRLAVAVADPTETKILNNIAANLNLTVVPFVATKKEIMNAVSIHYLNRQPSDDSQPTILIVEDDRLIATMLKSMLTRYGYNCLMASNGFEGYNMALEELPQLILTDKEMPKLDGYGLMATLKNTPETESIPVILVTGLANSDEEAKAFEKGFFDLIIKPMKEITLITRVKRALHFGTNLPVKIIISSYQPRK